MRIRALSMSLLVFLLSSYKLTDDAFTLLQNTLDKYLNTTEYSFNYQMNWYCEGKKGNGSVNGTYVKKGKNFMLHQGDGRTVQSDGYLLNINDRDKIIIIQRMQEETSSSDLFDMLKIEQEFVLGTVTQKEEGNNIKFTAKENTPLSYVSSSEIQLNASGWIKYSIFNYDPKAQTDFDQKCTSMRLDYVAYKFENVDAGSLRLSKYVIIDGNEVKAAAAYKSYEVISSLKIETE